MVYEKDLNVFVSEDTPGDETPETPAEGGNESEGGDEM